MKFARVIVDISIQKLDKTFDYIVPIELEGELAPGMKVRVPFGRRELTGYVLQISDKTEIEVEKLKPIINIEEKSVPIDFELILLAKFLKSRYGCTTNQALKTVIPSARKIARRKQKVIQTPIIDGEPDNFTLNKDQQKTVDGILANYPKSALIHGVTGSGKTEIYMRLIDKMIESGKQTILLIPEISLTMQNQLRFYARYKDRVGIVNSRLSAGEKYEIFEKARSGELDVMIGPRSALFTPFTNLGMIIIDEAHDGAYFSETTPRYKATEVAGERARISGAALVLGSATPLVSDYKKAREGIYDLYTLKNRASEGSLLPDVHIVDLRDELKAGNKTVFSRELADAISDRLSKHEQVMLFLNRRGYAGFVTCRDCGTPMKCPHCDVSLTYHSSGRLICHYCGHTEKMPRICPSCGSNQIATFGLGTQKLEAMTREYFPEAKVLRMDLDTTSGKAGHSKIISQFAKGKADILIGTQMIVKGHDFPSVTLVGIIAADLSLYSSDYRASEITFELLTQASGRAGRRDKKGLVVIQTYNPDDETIISAANQDYEGFYENEIAYRSALSYPPSGSMLSVMISNESDETANKEITYASTMIERNYSDMGISIIGPANANVKKIQDKYRYTFYVKSDSEDLLIKIRDDILEQPITSMLQMDIL